MKKLIIGTACALVVTGAAFAQGSVNWTGPSFTAITSQTNSTTYSTYSASSAGASTGNTAIGGTLGAASTGVGYYYELLIGAAWNGAGAAVPQTFAGFSSWTDSGLQASNNPTSAGRIVDMNANNGITVNGFSTTASNSIILVGWSANLGSTWSTALANAQSASYLAGLTSAAYFGVSNEGWIEAFAPGTVPGAVLFSGTVQTYGTPISSLNMQLDPLAVPEPGTLALAALGGASLLLFRRKK